MIYIFLISLNIIKYLLERIKNIHHKSNNKVIYTDDSMNNRLTKGKEYVVKSYEKAGGYYLKLDNDADMEEPYSVDFFSVRLIKQDWDSTSDLKMGENKKLMIRNTGELRIGIGDYQL